MRVSIVVAMFKMEREIPRTLHTLGADYQRGVAADDYEIVVVDNGSPEPLEPAVLESFPPNARYEHVETTSMSPAAAINAAIERTDAPYVGCMIDGARMLSPMVLRRSIDVLDADPRTFVYSPSFHLGSQLQNDSAVSGYNQQVEDQLLSSVNWKQDGYLLFEISNVATVPERLMLPTFESNCFFVTRDVWNEIGGYDERFASAGGGLVNWEFFKRAVETPDLQTVVLLGEASFHQFHGGASTNQPRNNHPVRGWFREYESLFGKPFRYPDYRPRVQGTLGDYLASIVYGSNTRTADAVIGELSRDGAHDAAVGLAYNRTRVEPNNPAALRSLADALLAAGRTSGAFAAIERAIEIAPTQAELFAARANLHRLSGSPSKAIESISEAMALDPLQHEAQFQLGLIERVAGNLDASIAAYKRALELNGTNRGDYVMQLVSALVAHGSFDEAQAHAHDWFSEAPRDVSARLDYVEALREANQDEEAKREVDGVIDKLSTVVLHPALHRRALAVLSGFDGAVERIGRPATTAEIAEDQSSTRLVAEASDASASMTPVSEIFDEFTTSVNDYFTTTGDEATRVEHALGGSISRDNASALQQFVTETTPSKVVVIGGYLGLSSGVIASALGRAASLEVFDPSVRHRIFDDPLGHAEEFLKRWSSDRQISVVRSFFGAKTIGPLMFDLTHFEPRYDQDAAREIASEPTIAMRAAETVDFVYVDLGVADVDLVAVASRAISIARPGAPIVFGSPNLHGAPELLSLVAEAKGCLMDRLGSRGVAVAGRFEERHPLDGLILLRGSQHQRKELLR